MRIDAHQHFWELDRFHYPWMPADPSPLRRNFLPRDLHPILLRNRFDGTVAVQAACSLDESRWLLELADSHPWILGVVAWVDLTSGGVGTSLDELQRHPRLKGIRHPVHDEADEAWLLRPDVIRGLREVAARDLAFDLLLRPHHLPLVPRLAEAVPRLRLVIDHIAKPAIARRQWDRWAADMEAAAVVPGLHVKLSGMITEAEPKTWTAADLRPYVAHVLRLFGPGRSMFGSDWPVCLQAGIWKEVLAAFTQAHGAIPRAERDQIIGETAARFYRLDAPQAAENS